ncbi:unnamed protein product [Leuciscus chuanchicus]
MEYHEEQNYIDEELDYLYGYLFSDSSEENTKNLLDAMYGHNFMYDFLLNEDLNNPLYPITVQTSQPCPTIHAGFSALNKTYGTVLAFVDGGHFLNLSILSAHHTHPSPVFQSENAALANALVVINTVFHVFAERIKNLPPEEKQRKTIMKNKSNNLRTNTYLKSGSTLHPKTANGGNRDPEPIKLAAMIDLTAIESKSVHAACTLRPKDHRMDMMWSRHGLQHVVGHRGSLYTAYGIPEASNFQSNPHTIEPNLKMVFSGMQPNADLNFVQLYSTTPHCHMGKTTKHPVSRVITTCGLHNAQQSQSLLKQAKDYFDYMRDLAGKTKCWVYARMEAVFLLKENIPERLEWKHMIFMMKRTFTPFFKNSQWYLSLKTINRNWDCNMSSTLLPNASPI